MAAIKYQLDQDSDEWQAKQDAARKAIDDEANRKRSEAIKDQPRKQDGTIGSKPVVVPKEPPPAKLETKPDPHKGRSERARAAIRQFNRVQADSTKFKRFQGRFKGQKRGFLYKENGVFWGWRDDFSRGGYLSRNEATPTEGENQKNRGG